MLAMWKALLESARWWHFVQDLVPEVKRSACSMLRSFHGEISIRSVMASAFGCSTVPWSRGEGAPRFTIWPPELSTRRKSLNQMMGNDSLDPWCSVWALHTYYMKVVVASQQDLAWSVRPGSRPLREMLFSCYALRLSG
jgi:hypothetical protein